MVTVTAIAIANLHEIFELDKNGYFFINSFQFLDYIFFSFPKRCSSNQSVINLKKALLYTCL